MPVAVVESAELGFDLDLPDDILTLAGVRHAGRTKQVVRDLDLEDRIAATARGA